MTRDNDITRPNDQRDNDYGPDDPRRQEEVELIATSLGLTVEQLRISESEDANAARAVEKALAEGPRHTRTAGRALELLLAGNFDTLRSCFPQHRLSNADDVTLYAMWTIGHALYSALLDNPADASFAALRRMGFELCDGGTDETTEILACRQWVELVLSNAEESIDDRLADDLIDQLSMRDTRFKNLERAAVIHELAETVRVNSTYKRQRTGVAVLAALMSHVGAFGVATKAEAVEKINNARTTQKQKQRAEGRKQRHRRTKRPKSR